MAVPLTGSCSTSSKPPPSFCAARRSTWSRCYYFSTSRPLPCHSLSLTLRLGPAWPAASSGSCHLPSSFDTALRGLPRGSICAPRQHHPHPSALFLHLHSWHPCSHPLHAPGLRPCTTLMLTVPPSGRALARPICLPSRPLASSTRKSSFAEFYVSLWRRLCAPPYRLVASCALPQQPSSAARGCFSDKVVPDLIWTFALRGL